MSEAIGLQRMLVAFSVLGSQSPDMTCIIEHASAIPLPRACAFIALRVPVESRKPLCNSILISLADLVDSGFLLRGKT
jgi:hypothetical protein